jgi:hypothetical protein
LSKNGIKQLHILPLLHFSRWLTTEYSETTLGQITKQYTDYKGVKNNSNFGQIIGIQEKLDTTCK